MNKDFRPSDGEFARVVTMAPEMGGCGRTHEPAFLQGGLATFIKSGLPKLRKFVLLGLFAPGVATADIRVTISTNVNVAIPDRGQYVSTLTIAKSGIQTINSVGLNLNLSTGGFPQQLFSTLTHGSASEAERFVQVFSNPVSIASSYTFGSQFDGAWLESNLWSLLVADQNKSGPTAQLS